MNFTQNKFAPFIASQKYPLLITLVFFLVVCYVGFSYHNYWIVDQDGIHLLNGGEQIINGDWQNVHFVTTPTTAAIFYAILNSVFNDGFTLMKLISIISGSATVLIVFFIIKNVSNYKTALIGQLLFAFNPWFSFFSMQAEIDVLAAFLACASLYFATKKNLKPSDMIIMGSILGASFMIRYQCIIIVITIIIFLLIRNKKIHINLSYVGLVVLLFLIVASPLFIYNYSTVGNISDASGNFAMQFGSKYQTSEWSDELYRLTKEGKGTLDGIFLDFDLFQKNYFYNLFYNAPNRLFNFIDTTNTSLVPAIPFIGLVPVFGGLVYLLKIEVNKTNIALLLGSISITTLFVLLFGDINIHFFAIIVIPILSLGVANIKKIQENLLPLLILPVVFPIVTSIAILRYSEQYFTMWISIAILSAIFFTEVIPKIYYKIKSKNDFQRSSKIFIVIAVFLVLIFLANIGYEYVLVRATSSGTSYVSVSDEFAMLFQNESLEQIGIEAEYIGEILYKQPGIQNSYVMANQYYYAHYFPANYIKGEFDEGPEDDTIENYITRKNWNDVDIYHSNTQSMPSMRQGLIEPRVDYLIFELYPTGGHIQHDYLKILSDPNNPNIPSNFESIYSSNKIKNITVYKIHYEN
jgi:4-amino-4-deoxy-L-arabinose transferase-like glycosyltransferase